MTGKIFIDAGTPKIEATITGTNFPSHRLFINGSVIQKREQGSFSELWNLPDLEDIHTAMKILLFIFLILISGCSRFNKLEQLQKLHNDTAKNALSESRELKHFSYIFPDSYWLLQGFKPKGKQNTGISLTTYVFGRYRIIISQEFIVDVASVEIKFIDPPVLIVEELERVERLDNGGFNIYHGITREITLNILMEASNLDEFSDILGLIKSSPITGFEEYKAHKLNIYRDFIIGDEANRLKVVN